MLLFAPVLLPQQAGQRLDDAPTPRQLFAGLLEDPVDELQVAADHPLGCPRDLCPAEEFERSPDSNHDTMV